jgi:translation initiation factor IF-1
MVVYGFNPCAPIDLLPLPPSEFMNLDVTQRSEFILKLLETTKMQIEKMNERYRIAASKGRKKVKLEPGDLVWIHLRKDRFPDLRKSKLMPRAAGPFKVLEKINDNVYKLELPPEFGVSFTFNISDLKPYLGEKDELESRTTPIQEGEDDEDISPLHTMQGPITRAHTRQLDLQVRSNLVNYFLELTLGSMHILLIRNNREDQQGLGEGQGVKEEELAHQGGVQVQLDFDSTSDCRT